MTDTAPDLAADRDPAHYAERVAATEDDLTAAQRKAIQAVRAARERQEAAERALRAAINDRVRTVQKNAPTLARIGWRPAARLIGGISETTLRSDADRNIKEN